MSETLLPGTIFAGYRIERVLGRGGMGTVYLARHPRLPRYDALKVLPSVLRDDREFCARFGREAEIAARLDHPNIVAVWDRGMEDGRLWIAMRFVDGLDAAVLIRSYGSGLPAERALHIITEAAKGLDEAHRAGLLHRDVKLANILIETRSDRPDRVYVSDFGIARSVSQTTALTQPGSVMATLASAAPEQLEAVPLDHRVDVYALGCALYELLTGAVPFPRSNEYQMLVAHLYETPPKATAANPALPPGIDDVIARAMAKEPGERYDSCGELAAAAAVALAGGSTPEPEPRPGLRKRWIAGALSVAVIATITSILVVKGGRSTDDVATPTTSAVNQSTPSGAVGWGNYAYVVQAFPALLPKTPLSSGFQNIRCVTQDGNAKVVDPSTPLGDRTEMMCRGDGNPVELFDVSCNTDRSAAVITPDSDFSFRGADSWEHSSGRGRIAWWDGTDEAGKLRGLLQVQFDDPARNFCQIEVIGKSTGRELVDRWFAVAPL